MNIGVIGYGMVGTAITKAFRRQHHTVAVYDIKIKESKLEHTVNSDIIYVCVPTRQNEDGSCDNTVVESTIKRLSELNYKGTIAIKSTVEPGTTSRLQQEYSTLTLAHVPEFLRERCGYEDFTDNHNVLVVGTEHRKAFLDIVNSHHPYPKNTIQVKPTESELTKYFSNSYKALRTVFSSTYGKISDHLEVDYSTVLKAFLLEGVEDDAYLGYSKEVRGFGGSCLPKDVSALDFFTKENKLDLDVFGFTLRENKKF
jgi:UDPglucose 6-dehydrogenase